MNFKFHGNLTYDEFLIEWFGYHGGRELGNPLQVFTDVCQEIVPFVKNCEKESKPAYMSVAYRKKHNEVSGLDRIFFDFDYHEEPKDEEKLLLLEGNVKNFVRSLKPIVPLIVKTYHGYHVWVFFKTTILYDKEDELKKIYFATQRYLLKNKEYEMLDTNPLGDVKRIARIPLSWHEKGAYCIIVDENLQPTKIRSVEYFKNNGLLFDDVAETVKTIINTDSEREIFVDYDIPKNFNGTFGIRPCFHHALRGGEMDHQQRLAFLIEAHYAGYGTEKEILDFFRNMRDFNENITKTQYRWFINRNIYKRVRPYKCRTIQKFGWCIKDECEVYRRKMCKMP